MVGGVARDGGDRPHRVPRPCLPRKPGRRVGQFVRRAQHDDVEVGPGQRQPRRLAAKQHGARVGPQPGRGAGDSVQGGAHGGDVALGKEGGKRERGGGGEGSGRVPRKTGPARHPCPKKKHNAPRSAPPRAQTPRPRGAGPSAAQRGRPPRRAANRPLRAAREEAHARGPQPAWAQRRLPAPAPHPHRRLAPSTPSATQPVGRRPPRGPQTRATARREPGRPRRRHCRAMTTPCRW